MHLPVGSAALYGRLGCGHVDAEIELRDFGKISDDDGGMYAAAGVRVFAVPRVELTLEATRVDVGGEDATGFTVGGEFRPVEAVGLRASFTHVEGDNAFGVRLAWYP